MSRKQKNRVGVIGLGQVGSKVSAGLRSAGFSVYVWNRSPRAEPNFLGSAIEVADLCDTIQLFVPDDAALDGVIRMITAALRPRHVIIASTTVTPSTARGLGAIVESAGARYVDAPFAGCRADAEARKLVYYVGGTESAIKDATPVLQATSRSIVPVGAVGDASLLKLSLQMLMAVTLEGMAEALSFVRAGGLKPEALLDALEADPTRSEFVSEKLSAMVKGNFEGGMPIRHLFRDLQLALKISGSNPGVPASGVVAGLLFGAMKRGWANSDGAIISRAFEPDPPPAPPTPKTEPVAIEPAAVEPTSDLEMPAVEAPGAEAGPALAADAKAAAQAPADDVPAKIRELHARSGMIPETHGGQGGRDGGKPRPGLELLHTTPVVVGGPLKPTTNTPAESPGSTTPPVEPINPVGPAPSILPARTAMPAPLAGKLRPPQTVSVPLPPFPAAPPESPHFPTNLPHRVNRRLSDTTTNLQKLLQSELESAPAKATSPIPSPANSADNGLEKPDTENGEATLEAITAEVLPPLPNPPVIAPVIPGDIRPSQRIPLRVADTDALPRPRLIRDPKSKSWIHRLIGG